MEAYYDSVSRGIKATELLVETLGANLRKILPEGFRKEIIRTVDLRLRTKTWLSDPKALQARLDLALLQLLDQKKVGEMLLKIKHSANFYEEVLLNLIENEIPELCKEYDSFTAIVKGAIKSTVAAASLVPTGKAKKLINDLNSHFLTLFKDNYLAMNLITDSDGYEDCDNEEENVFMGKCLQIAEGLAFQWKIHDSEAKRRKDLSHQVLVYMRNVRREDFTRPRCQASCPHCEALCIHPVNHDISTVKHDTFHQPGGLAGVTWTRHENQSFVDTLCEENCTQSYFEDYYFDSPGGEQSYQDFDKVYPEWMNPKLMDRLPLREYIFANYQKALANIHEAKKCLNIPADYQHDLETIRRDLERAANLSQDK